jgi:hypothetical protein
MESFLAIIWKLRVESGELRGALWKVEASDFSQRNFENEKAMHGKAAWLVALLPSAELPASGSKGSRLRASQPAGSPALDCRVA